MDRNFGIETNRPVRYASLSARRAWIEIILDYFSAVMRQVALRKESVDRNLGALPLGGPRAQSLSARRAWIEIGIFPGHSLPQWSLSARRAWIEIMEDLEPSTTRRVALRKESVDRNWLSGRLNMLTSCRSPQGERG